MTQNGRPQSGGDNRRSPRAQLGAAPGRVFRTGEHGVHGGERAENEHGEVLLERFAHLHLHPGPGGSGGGCALPPRRLRACGLLPGHLQRELRRLGMLLLRGHWLRLGILRCVSQADGDTRRVEKGSAATVEEEPAAGSCKPQLNNTSKLLYWVMFAGDTSVA